MNNEKIIGFDLDDTLAITKVAIMIVLEIPKRLLE